jgi:hypothetical protein
MIFIIFKKEMAKLLIVCSIIIIAIAMFIYNLATLLEIYKKVSLVNNKNCTSVKGAIGMEDLIKYKHFLISGSNDNGKLWEREEFKLKTPNGKMVVVDTSKSISEHKIEDLLVNNFPKDFKFHPHGLYLYKNKYIYVINHAYNKGGERVEVFEIVDTDNKIELNHLRSIPMDKEYTGIFNSLVVIGDNDEMLITTFLSSPDCPQKGRQSSLLTTLRMVSVPALGLKWTYIHHCRGNQCKIVPGSESVMSNGITYDTKRNKIYSVNGSKEGQMVYKFSLNKNNEESILTLEKKILIGYVTDNLKYDEESGLITGGIIGRMADYFDVVEYLKKHGNLGGELRVPSGSCQIDTNQDDKVDVLVMQDDQLYVIATAVIVNNLVYHSSSVDDGILICKK